MKLGLSLPFTYLSGNNLNQEDQLWCKVYGTPQEALKQLKDLGLTSIEINKLGPQSEVDFVKQAVETVLAENLGLTVHGWLPNQEKNKQLPAVFTELSNLLKHYSSPVPMTIHGHSYNDEVKREIALKQSLADLTWHGKNLSNQKTPLFFTLEVCRSKGEGPIGTSYHEVYTLAEQAGFDSIGLCWDFGHTQANYSLGLDQAYPSQKFSRQVQHTHIHDVGADGRTHFPLETTQGYVSNCIKILQDANYSGTYNLELYPIRWSLTPVECKLKLAESITKLRQMVEY